MFRSAQRLPASRRRTAYLRSAGTALRGVLNAFRHHGDERTDVDEVRPERRMCSTPSGITATNGSGGHGARAPEGGLNPFRHHGDERPAPVSYFTWPSLCSTPSGITATNGRRTSKDRRDLQVLNAFRHTADDR